MISRQALFAARARFWAGELGCEVGDLDRPGITVVAHALDYRGAQLLRRRETCVVSVPEGWLPFSHAAFRGRLAEEIFGEEPLRAAFGEAVERVIGPAYLGYVSPEGFREVPPEGVRPLTTADRPALERLRGACEPEEWDHCGAELDHPDLMGLMEGREILALGVLDAWGPDLLHLGILTHPGHRGRGYARRVVSALTAEAFRRGKVPQYRTLVSNQPAWAVAQALGYEEWARMFAVRLRSAAPAG